MKANLPDLLAAVLPRQIEAVRNRLDLREKHAGLYERALADTPIRLAAVKDGAVSARHLFPIHVPPHLRDETIGLLNREGIGITVNFRSVPTTTYYRRKYGFRPEDFPVSYEWGEGTLSLPLFPELAEEDLAYVISVLNTEIVSLIDRHGHAVLSPNY